MRSIQAAVVEAAQEGKDVYAAAGAYDRFDAADDVGVYGGYRPDTGRGSLTLVDVDHRRARGHPRRAARPASCSST